MNQYWRARVLLGLCVTVGCTASLAQGQGRGRGHAGGGSGPQARGSSGSYSGGSRNDGSVAGQQVYGRSSHDGVNGAEDDSTSLQRGGPGQNGSASVGPSTRPPGWDHGKKVGWGDCNLPPGLAKKEGCLSAGAVSSEARSLGDVAREERNRRTQENSGSTGRAAGPAPPANGNPNGGNTGTGSGPGVAADSNGDHHRGAGGHEKGPKPNRE